MKRVLAVMLVLCMLAVFLPMNTITVNAASNGVEQKIAELENLFPTGSYFTTTGTKSCSKNIVYGSNYSYCYSSSCPNCKLGNVLEQNSKAKNTIVPSVCLRGGRYSCYGFATFAFCYIFEHDPDINVTSISSSSYGGINSNFLSKLKAGDLIECDGGSHYAIFLKYDSNYLYLYESNFDSPNQVEYNHKRTWNRWSTIKAYRSNSYSSISSGQTPSETKVEDYYKLTSPDGYQTVRASASTSSENVGTLYKGDIVCVTKYNSDRTWGYIEKGSIKGWIRLYYIESHSHSYSSWSTTKAATCTAEGSKKRSCACGKTETATITKLGHDYSSSWTIDKAATCTEKGSKSYHCSRCSAKKSVTEIAAAGHSYSSSYTVDKAATCTQSGTKSKHCAKCSARTNITTINALGHNWGEFTVTAEATTQKQGTAVRKCKAAGCGATETKTLPKLATDGHTHSFGEWTVKTEATCLKDGVQQRSCKTCSQIEEQTISATGHSFGEWSNADSKGNITRECEICGETQKENNGAEIKENNKSEAEKKPTSSISNEKDDDKPTNNIWVLYVLGALILCGIVVLIIVLIKKR